MKRILLSLLTVLGTVQYAMAQASPQPSSVPFIRPRQEGVFKAVIEHPAAPAKRVIGTLGDREVLEIDSPVHVSSMGKMMTVDNKGYVWYVETREDRAIRVNPKTLEMVSYGVPRGSGPYAISADSKGTLWITAHGIEMLLELNPEKGEVISHAPPSHGFLIHINVDKRDDTIYFCQPGANLIVSYRPDRGFKEFKIPTEQAGPGRLDFDSQGNIWFPELYTNKVGKLNPKTGEMQEWDLPVPDGLPSYTRVDRDDSVWISLPEADKILRFKDGNFEQFSIPTRNSIVSTTVGDDSQVWFTEGGWRGSAGGNKIGLLTIATKRIEELSLPTPNAQPLGMIKDNDGNIWFQQSSAGKICRMTKTNNTQVSRSSR